MKRELAYREEMVQQLQIVRGKTGVRWARARAVTASPLAGAAMLAQSFGFKLKVI